MMLARCLALTLATCVAATACGERIGEIETTAEGSRADPVVAWRAPDGSRRVTRIDGNVDLRTELPVFSDPKLDTVLLTGAAGGTDQGQLIVLRERGEPARHRVSRDTPEGIRPLSPISIAKSPATHRGHRFIAVTTGGVSFPYSVEVIEAAQDGALRPAMRFWNLGSIQPPVMGDGLLAVRCINNAADGAQRGERYPVAVVVLSLDDAVAGASSGQVHTGVGPGRGDDRGSGYVACYFLGMKEEHLDPRSEVVEISSGKVFARMLEGITYVIDPRTDAVSVEFTKEYEQRWARRCADDPKELPLEEHRVALQAQVTALRPAPR